MTRTALGTFAVVALTPLTLAAQAIPPVPPLPPRLDLPLVIDLPQRAELPLLRPELPPLPELPMLTDDLLALQAAVPVPPAPSAPPQPRPAPAARPAQRNGLRGSAEDLYSEARELIDRGRYDRSLEYLDRVATMQNSTRADAALYWKAYAQWKLDQRADALATLAEMRKRFAQSRWAKDAQALDVEIRQASGQSVSPDGQASEEIKLLALRGLMNSDPERAIPMIEQLLAGPSTVRVKENALFVLSQSRTARAREIIAAAAKGSVNPDLQLRAVRYLGAIGGADNRQILDDVYRGTTDVAVKRAIIRSLGAGAARDRLLALAKSETSPELRAEAVRSLGAANAGAELDELYRSETATEVKEQIIRAMVASRSIASLTRLATSEPDARLRRAAIRNLGAMGSANTGETLRSLYTSNSGAEVRNDVIDALTIQQNASVLVALARTEKDQALRRRIVERLSTMRGSKEATEYMLELLK